jgi:phosphomannomutase
MVAAKACEKPVVMRNLCCSELVRSIFPVGGEVELVDTPVGHAKIKELMRSPAYRERIVFAGEHSGHYFYPDFHFVDSGNLTTLEMFKVAASAKAKGRSLSDLLSGWRERFAWSGEINFEFASVPKVNDALDSLYRRYRGEGERYGVRVEEGSGHWRVYRAEPDEPYEAAEARPQDLKFRFPASADAGWWFVVRPSGNEPKLRLNVEAWGEGAGTALDGYRAMLAKFLVDAGGTELVD